MSMFALLAASALLGAGAPAAEDAQSSNAFPAAHYGTVDAHAKSASAACPVVTGGIANRSASKKGAVVQCRTGFATGGGAGLSAGADALLGIAALGAGVGIGTAISN